MVLGDVLPETLTVGGLELAGPALRYARVDPGHDELCALGLTHAAGVITCLAATALRLRRLDGGCRVTTGAGFSLAESWLGGPVGAAAVQGLDGAWHDVSQQCAGGQVPEALVREWSRRNQRSLVEFWLRR